jgi:hypothetical protein
MEDVRGGRYPGPYGLKKICGLSAIFSLLRFCVQDPCSSDHLIFELCALPVNISLPWQADYTVMQLFVKHFNEIFQEVKTGPHHHVEVVKHDRELLGEYL